MSIHSAHLTRRSWLGLALGASVPSVANAAVRRIDFGTMPPNQAPIGFTVALTGRGPASVLLDDDGRRKRRAARVGGGGDGGSSGGHGQ